MIVLLLLPLLLEATETSGAGDPHGAKWSVFHSNTASMDLEASIGGSFCSLQDAKSGFCSVWTYCKKGKCECGEAPNEIIQCNVGKNLSVVDYNCVTYDENRGLFEAGSCMYTSVNITSMEAVDTPVHILPREVSSLDYFLCGKHFNRTGTLCGKCKEHHYTPAYSFDMTCVRCPNGKSNWWKFVLAVFLPLTLLYFVVFFLNLNTTSSHLYCFVQFSQLITAPALMRLLLLDVKNRPRLLIALRTLL